MTARFRIGVCAVFVSALLSGTTIASAQESLSITVTPPLFQLTINPGESWTSNVKVVNNNAYDVAYQPQIVDFEARGESGQGTFVPLVSQFGDDATTSTHSLGSWIEISKAPVYIRAGKSAQITFTVHVPQSAEPGGHYAAIMIGPKETDSGAGSRMRVTSFVTSLLMIRVKGDIVESGRIREFSSDKDLYQKAEAHFLLRFENTGNTHLQPRGSIILYNMWGKERGRVDINENSNFGNVLPKSIRRFEFDWSGDDSLFDIGLYKAMVTLNFGEDGKQNSSATTYFWVVPIVPVSIALGAVLLFIALLMWFIRRYIRRALMIEQMHRGFYEHPDVPDRAPIRPEPSRTTLSALVQPIREGVVDLRSIRGSQPVSTHDFSTSDEVMTAGKFFGKYRLFFMFIVVLMIAAATASLFFGNVLVSHRDFQIKEVKQDSVQAVK